MTTVINLYGSSGSGKSTASMGLTYLLRLKGYRVEYVSEYAKDLVFENSLNKLQHQLYVFSEQLRRMDILLNKDLDYIVTDSPLILTIFYGQKYDTLIPYLPELVLEQVKKFNNIDFFLKRAHLFDQVGRVQNEVESNLDSENLVSLLSSYNIKPTVIETCENIADELFNRLQLQ